MDKSPNPREYYREGHEFVSMPNILRKIEPYFASRLFSIVRFFFLQILSISKLSDQIGNIQEQRKNSSNTLL